MAPSLLVVVQVWASTVAIQYHTVTPADPLDCADLAGEFERVAKEGGGENSDGAVALVALPAPGVHWQQKRRECVLLRNDELR